MITIKDIARETGLSAATVARALGEGKLTRPETREKVREAADRLGYVASSAARSMRNQSSNMLGLIVPDIVNRFYSEMARAIAASCDQRGFHFLLSVTADNPQRELSQLKAMVAARAAAVALVPGPQPHSALASLAIRQPFVQLVRRSNEIPSDWFGFEDEAGIEAATAHLLHLGHRHILHICSNDRFSTGNARQRGYYRAFAKFGISADPTLIRAGEPTVAHGRAAMADLPESVTAVVAAGSLLTEGAVDFVHRAGYSIPQDLSFIGFGVENWLGWWQGGMTRIVPPVGALAESSVAHLLTRIDDGQESVSREPKHLTFKTRLEIGRTTMRLGG